tara:strand:+ start:157 stop:861 length:705 start_codon:yes stop_codon:yes gene_type:complete
VRENHVRALVREQVRRRVIVESYAKACDLILEANELNEFDISSLAASATSFLGDNLGPAFTDSIKQYLVELLFQRLESMGLPTDPTSIVGRAIVNVIEELEWTDLSKYIEDESACGEIADVLMAGVQEGFQEKGIDELMAVMFGVPGRRLKGFVASPIRELINAKIKDMTDFMRDPVRDFFCDHRDINKLIDGFKSSLPGMGDAAEEAGKAGSKAADAVKKYSKDELYDLIGRE